MKKLLKGLLEGISGVELKRIFDEDGDGKVSWGEIKNASFDKWVRAGVSIGTSVATIMLFL